MGLRYYPSLSIILLDRIISLGPSLWNNFEQMRIALIFSCSHAQGLTFQMFQEPGAKRSRDSDGGSDLESHKSLKPADCESSGEQGEDTKPNPSSD